MKKRINFALFCVFVLSVFFVLAGCASGPQLGQPTLLQEALNLLPAVPVAGKNLKFEFGGDTWISTVDGKNFSAGSFTSEDTADGSYLTLKQTHVYSSEKKPIFGGDVGWVSTPGPDINLEYKKGPPPSLGLR